MSTDRPKRGPKPASLKIEGNWKDAVGKAMAKGKPPKGSPKKKRRSK
jgi:hypothetical protein